MFVIPAASAPVVGRQARARRGADGSRGCCCLCDYRDGRRDLLGLRVSQLEERVGIHAPGQAVLPRIPAVVRLPAVCRRGPTGSSGVSSASRGESRGLRPAVWWAIVPIAILSALPHKESRYVIPVVPFVSICAAAGLTRAIQWTRTAASPRLARGPRRGTRPPRSSTIWANGGSAVRTMRSPWRSF